MRRFLSILVLIIASAGAGAAQTVSAILEPAQMVEVRTSVPGRLVTLDVVEGAEVSADTLLAAIDAKVQEARVGLASIAALAKGPSDRAAIVVKQAEELLARVENARRKGAAKPWEVAQAQQALDLAKADAEIAAETRDQLRAQHLLEQATLAEFSMRAPFDGTVLQIFAQPGEIVGTDQPIMEFGDLSRLKATAFVPLDWARQMQVGESLNVNLQGDPMESAEIQITSIDPRIDPASRSVRVQMEIDNTDRAFFAGMAIVLNAP